MRCWSKMMRAGVVLYAAVSLPAIAQGTSGDTMAKIADDIVANRLAANPFLPLYTDIGGGRNDILNDISPAAIARNNAEVDALLARLDALDRKTLTDRAMVRDYAIAREMLEAERGLRVCHSELWTVSHMDGWPGNFPNLAERQPVATAKDRADALARWGGVPEFIAADIANLKQGIAKGYVVPRSVAVRALAQVEGLISETPEQSPFFAPAKAADDAAFKAAFAALVRDRITPAIRGYRDFLRDTYIPAARESLSVLDLPDGRACYNAMLRSYTTLDRSGEDVAALGERTVAANVADVRAIGKKLYGIDDFSQIVARVKADPEERFTSKDEIVAYNRDVVERARTAVAAIIDHVPQQPLEVRPMTDAMEAAGVSSNYTPAADPSKPALYMLQVGKVEDARRADMAITAVHEGYPGHHLQFAYAAGQPNSKLSKIGFNSAYIEGWARYSERLSEEIGLLDTPQMKISRRAWPARGMVADPGLHIGKWSRERMVAYLTETGRFPPEVAKGMIDRIASLPGQLTAYDSGGLEIVALREQARKALGKRFDIKEFNAVVLGDGVVPLALLRNNVEAWIAGKK
ncbi:MAG: DUF885 domain-containing protein [Sphingobium sp.]|jgi:uncharacterized protein (DUF885 family)